MQARRRSPRVCGIAALLTLAVMIAGALWFAFRPDDDTHASARPSTAATAAPSRSPSPPSPPGPRDGAHQRRERVETRAVAAAEAAHDGDEDGSSAPTPMGEPLTDADVAAAHGWLDAALTWREEDASLGPWGRAVDRANAGWAVGDVATTFVPATALEHIAFDATVHGALPRVIEVTDESNPKWDTANVVTLSAAVVFGTGDGWTRPGLRLLVTFEVVDSKVTSVFIDDGYVVSDPKLLP